MVIGLSASHPSFSAIKESMASGLGHQALSFSSTKGLYVQTGTSSDFLNAFRSRDHLDARATLREVAVGRIKDAIDREFGAGMGDRAFVHAARSDSSVAGVLVKNDLDALETAIRTLQAEDHAPANALLGTNVTIDELFETAPEDGCLRSGRAIDDRKRNDLKNKMVAAVTALPAGTSPEECRRAAQHVILKFDLACEFDRRSEALPEDEREQKRGELETHVDGVLGDSRKHIPLWAAAYALRQACMSMSSGADFGPACAAQLDALGMHGTSPASQEWQRTRRASANGAGDAIAHEAPGAERNAGGAPRADAEQLLRFVGSMTGRLREVSQWVPTEGHLRRRIGPA